MLYICREIVIGIPLLFLVIWVHDDDQAPQLEGSN